MNTKNNKRRQETVRTIERIFLNYLQTREVSEISVSDLCKDAEINRTTFYACFTDVRELAAQVREKLGAEVGKLFAPEEGEAVDYPALFRQIAENQLFFTMYFKLADAQSPLIELYDLAGAEKRFDGRFVDYHREFFLQGLNAILRKWLRGGCQESPEEMAGILRSEYAAAPAGSDEPDEPVEPEPFDGPLEEAPAGLSQPEKQAALP